MENSSSFLHCPVFRVFRVQRASPRSASSAHVIAQSQLHRCPRLRRRLRRRSLHCATYPANGSWSQLSGRKRGLIFTSHSTSCPRESVKEARGCEIHNVIDSGFSLTAFCPTEVFFSSFIFIGKIQMV